MKIASHLMPVYVFPELLEIISPAFEKRMHGKSCFNFKAPDARLFQEVKELTETGYEKYNRANYL